jgi:hypothetical protein
MPTVSAAIVYLMYFASVHMYVCMYNEAEKAQNRQLYVHMYVGSIRHFLQIPTKLTNMGIIIFLIFQNLRNTFLMEQIKILAFTSIIKNTK